MYGHLVIRQNGIYYYSTPNIRIEFNGWHLIQRNNLTAEDFIGRRFDGTLIEDPNLKHPDFSGQGTPMTFGFERRSGGYVGLQYNVVYEISKWQVTVTKANPPLGNQPPVATKDEYVIRAKDNFTPLYFLHNDYDPNNDSLEFTEVFTNGVRSYVSFGGKCFVRYSSRFNAEPDSFRYLISDGEFTSTASVQIYIDCFCIFNCFNNFSLLSPATDSVDLDLIYRLRDQVMKPAVDGNRYIEMYYTTTPEIARILMVSHRNLWQEAVALVELWQDNLYSLVDGNGSTLIMRVQVDAIQDFLVNLRAAGSTEFQQLIDAELGRIGLLDDYVGLTIAQAKTKAIGQPTAPKGGVALLLEITRVVHHI